MAEVNRGEIWQFSFPSPNRRRPVLILTRQEVIGYLHSVTVAPLISTIRGIPSTLKTESTFLEGLRLILAKMSTYVSDLPPSTWNREPVL